MLKVKRKVKPIRVPVIRALELPERAVAAEDCRVRCTWEVPASCNMQPECPYCSNAWQRSRMPTLPVDFDRHLAGLQRLGEEYGPLHLSVCFGEPTSNPAVVAAIGILGQRHKIDVSTNLLFDLNDIACWPRNGNIRLATSWHPHRWKLSEFIRKRGLVEDSGIGCGVCGIVAWPPYLDRLATWCSELRSAGIQPDVHPFYGSWNGRNYPDSYTEAERKLVFGEVEATYGVCLTGESTRGRLCRAGERYLFISFHGNVLRCYTAFSEILGSLDSGVRLLEGPTPCHAEQCPCSDLWRMLA